MELAFIADPGHGWLEVPMLLVLQLGIKDSISRFSYASADGAKAYLEEDCDMAKFINAWNASGRERIKVKDHYCHGDAFVRRLPRINN